MQDIFRKINDLLTEHTQCYALFYFDGEGKPLLYTFHPQMKDRLAIQRFIQDYLESDTGSCGQLKEGDPNSDSDEDDGEEEPA